ncbi:MAG: 3-hydroxyacyl-CoA dehydrogenase [Thermoanaerobaculia bacterium]|nr:3-hydroxyacyl-CoA dehydrogenase [Thermoanaerobaculia bacterium]
MQIDGRTFLITGGGSGLGEATARRLCAGGGRVVLADVNEERGGALAAELGDVARFAATDVTREEAVRAAIGVAEDAFGALDGAVSCAGIGDPALVLGKKGPHPLELYERVIRVNLVGTFNTLRLAAEAISRNEPGEDGERGVIVNTASVAAFDGQIGQAAYASSKGGVVGLTLPAARELARFGIRVVTIAPGLFDTPLMAGLPEAARDSLAQQVPFPRRLGEPAEYADLVAHIVGNRMLNGETIRLDGAIRMAPR